jgi:hypothetical protein
MGIRKILWEPQEGEVLERDEDGNPSSIEVRSDSRPDLPYVVRWTTLRIENEETDEESYIKSWVCSCKAYEYGGGKPCKHIKRSIPDELIVDLSEKTGHD